jgi:transcriptional regulator with XRE-family HTH domain
MSYGFPWSKEFIAEFGEKEFRDEFVADKVKTRIALMIRALREQEGRDWTQTDLGKKMGKPPNVISRLENPDYGKMSLQTLLEVAAAFELPLLVDIPSWDDWFRKMGNLTDASLQHQSFDLKLFTKPTPSSATGTNVSYLDEHRQKSPATSGPREEGNLVLNCVAS